VALALGAVALAVAVGDAVGGVAFVTMFCESAGAAFCTTASVEGSGMSFLLGVMGRGEEALDIPWQGLPGSADPH
jgi:hypothetical protein